MVPDQHIKLGAAQRLQAGQKLVIEAASALTVKAGGIRVNGAQLKVHMGGCGGAAASGAVGTVAGTGRTGGPGFP